MKVLLIEPHKSPKSIGGEDFFIYESLALEYLAAGIREHHDVRMLDMRLNRDLHGTLETFQPDVVGITAYTVHVNTVLGLFQTVREWNPEILTIVGGHHATVVPEDFLSPHIDLVVMGEGVGPLRSILQEHENGKRYDTIPGVAVPADGGLQRPKELWSDNLDDLPFPDRTLTSEYRSHYYSEWMKPIASIRTSRGCPFRCTFCALWKLTGGRYLERDPEKIVEELAAIKEPYVFFADDESIVNMKRMEKLARLIQEAGLKKKFFLYGRPDTISRHPDLLELWQESGLERIFVGFEFSRESDLKYINKDATIQHSREAARILNRLGLDAYASFILRAEFTREDFRDLRDHCHDLDLGFCSFAVLTPLPGTDFYAAVKDRMITHNYDYFDFNHTLLPTTLPLEEFYREYIKLFKTATSFSNKIALFKKFPLKDYPMVISKSLLYFKELKRAPLDYQ